jgi:hypothetical protein
VALNFRGDQAQTQAVERIFPDGEFWISTTDKTSATLSTVFADNHGPDKTLVQDGLYRFRILGTGPPQGPRDFADGMRFEKPFYYDPAQGNLLIEHIWRGTGSPIPQPAIDIQSSPDFALVAAGGNPDATSGIRLTGYSVMQFEFGAPPPGDYNKDGKVDAADYVVWRKGWETTYSQTDYDMWRTHFGETTGSGAALRSAEPLSLVPEPSTSVITGLALLSLFPRRSNKSTNGCRFLKRRYLLMTLMLTGVCANFADAQVKVFILAGQSNAVGFAGNANDLPVSLREPFEDVLFWYDMGPPGGRLPNDTHVRPIEGTSTWVPLRPQEEFGGRVAFDKPDFGFTGQSITTGHGAELTLGRELAGNLSDEIAILKFAWNGTPLANLNGQLDWNVSSQGEYYDWMVAETSSALSRLETNMGSSGTVAGLFWMQGEADAYAGTAALYEENLVAFVNAVREEWGENLPVVIARAHKDGIDWVHPVIPGIDEPYLADVRAAQASVAATSQFVRLVDLDDIPLTNDSLHFDSAGLRAVGQRLADAYFAIDAGPLPGDFNHNGVVDATDYVVWRKTGGSADDYNTWRTNFGRTSGAGAAANLANDVTSSVPEVSSIALLLLGVAFSAATYSRRSRRFLGML